MMTLRLAQTCVVAALTAASWPSKAQNGAMPDEKGFSAVSRMFSPPVTSKEVYANVDTGLYYGSYRRFQRIESPGFHGIAPSLGIAYDSLSKGKFTGVGWSIVGFSTIERDLSETITRGVTFRLDGEMLVACSEVVPSDRSPSCATGGTHTTRTESYRRIRFDEQAATWTVWEKDGTQTTYASVASRNHLGTPMHTVFGVDSVVDANGNEVSFSWQSVPSAHGVVAYPYLVEYNPAHPTRIAFLYGRSPDPVDTADGRVTQRLDVVQITVDDTMARGYKMVYATSDATGRSLISEIREYGRDAILQMDAVASEYYFNGKPKDSPAVFSYSSDADTEQWGNGVDYPSLPIFHDLSSEDICPDRGVRPIDLDGDGLVDFLQARILQDGTPQMNAWLNRGNRFEAGSSVYWTDEEGNPLPAFFRDFCGDQGVRIADLNGDGLKDIVQALRQGVDGGVYEHFGAWLNTGRGWRKDDAYRVPQDELPGPYSLYFTSTYCGNGYCGGVGGDKGLRIVDINGDGRADLVRRSRLFGSFCQDEESYTQTYFNVPVDSANATASSAWSLDEDGEHYGMGSVPFFTVSGPNICWPGMGSGDQGVHFLDLNGDGRTDILQTVFFADGLDLSSVAVYDVNQDGRVDWFEPPNDAFVCPHGVRNAWINTGTEFVPAPGFAEFTDDAEPFGGPFPYLVDQARFNGDAGIRIADINGDGRDDLVQKYRGYLGNNFDADPHTIQRVWLSTGTGWKRADSLAAPLPFFADVAYSGGRDFRIGVPRAYWKPGTLLVDVDGDGSTDVVQGYDGYFDEDPRSLIHDTSADDVRKTVRRVWLNKHPQRDLLESGTTEAGLREDITYKPSTSWDYGQSVVVVPTVSSIAQAEYPEDDAQHVTDYVYEGAAFDPVDRVFNGFERAFELLPPITSGNAGDRPYRTIVFRRTIPSRGKVWMISLMDSAGARLWHQTRFHNESVDGYPYTSLEEQRLTYRYGRGGERILHRVGMTYDDYGNLATYVDYGASTDDPFTSAASYDYDTSRFIVDQIKQRDTYARNGGELLRRSLYFYDSSGNLRHHYRYAGDGLYVGSHFEYYPNGMLKVFTDELDRRTRYVRDDGYYVNEIQNPLYAADARQREVQKWDVVCGRLQESTDGNNLATLTEYDDFCRLRHITNPAGDTTLVRYWKNPSSGLGVTTNIDNGVDDEQWKVEEFDGFGRLRETRREGPNDTSDEEEIFDVWLQYDGHDRVVAEARPHYCGERSNYKAGPDERLVTRKYYDALGRPIRAVLPDGNERTWSYDLLTTIMTDERGSKTRTVSDVWGRVVEASRWIDDEWHSVYYQYDEFGQLLQVDDEEGNVITFRYDPLGRQTFVSHPDTGDRSFRYDAAGQLYEREDAAGQITRTTHDALGRALCTEVGFGANEAERYCRYYDWQRDGYFNVGQVTTETFGGVFRVLNHDETGNVVYSLVENGESHLTTWSYDAWSRLLSIGYPDGDRLGTSAAPSEYDDAGRLMAIPGVLDSVEYTADGRPLLRSDASGASVDYDYTPDRGFLERIAIWSNGTVAHALSHTHKENGFVESVSSTEPSQSWVYDYDEAGRLAYAEHGGRSWEYHYTPFGNLIYNGDTGESYTYPQAGSSRPHAPISVGGDVFSYDDNGNLLEGRDRTLVWNADGRLIAANGARFGYEASGRRYFKSEDGTNTFYLDGGVEYSKGTYTKYITAGGAGLVAKRVGSTTSWLHTDHLGSIVGIGDASGSIDVQAFRPYGYPDRTVEGERRGFSGQRHDRTGLIYLNDRYYDPGTAIFTSADRHFVRDPAETQRSPIEAVNAYQYALNNPVNNTDRTGNAVVRADAAWWPSYWKDVGNWLRENGVPSWVVDTFLPDGMDLPGAPGLGMVRQAAKTTIKSAGKKVVKEVAEAVAEGAPTAGKKVKRNIDVPDRKLTRGEKKQAKRDAKARGDAKNNSKQSGHRTTKGGSKKRLMGKHEKGEARRQREQNRDR